MSSTVVILLVCGVVALSILVVALAAGTEARERAEWQAFVDINDCHVVEIEEARTESSFGPGIGFDGKVTLILQTISRPGRECWLCANGVRYWKKAGTAIDRRKGGSE